MAISTGPINRPIRPIDTYELDTARTAIVRAGIRKDIEPNTGFWQFQLQPWHYWTAITSTVIVFVGFGILVATIGLHR